VGPSLCITDQETQEENLLVGTNPFTGQSLHPSPVQCSRSIQCMKTVQAPIQVLIFHCFLWDQLWASQIMKLWKRICWVEPTLLQVSSFTQDISCTKLNWSIQHMHTVQVLKQVLIFHLFCGTKSLHHRSRKWGPREFARWNQPFYKSVLTPISCSKLKTHSAYEDSPGSKTSPNFSPFLWD